MYIILLFLQIFGCIKVNSLPTNNYLIQNDSESYIDVWEEDERVHVIRITNNRSLARTILVPNFNSEVNKNSSYKNKAPSERPVLYNCENITDEQNKPFIANKFDKNVVQQVNKPTDHIYGCNTKTSSSNETNEMVTQYNTSAEFITPDIKKQQIKFGPKLSIKHLLKNITNDVNNQTDTGQLDTKKLAKCKYFIYMYEFLFKVNQY